jgi:hypothetical protein
MRGIEEVPAGKARLGQLALKGLLSSAPTPAPPTVFPSPVTGCRGNYPRIGLRRHLENVANEAMPSRLVCRRLLSRRCRLGGSVRLPPAIFDARCAELSSMKERQFRSYLTVNCPNCYVLSAM